VEALKPEITREGEIRRTHLHRHWRGPYRVLSRLSRTMVMICAADCSAAAEEERSYCAYTDELRVVPADAQEREKQAEANKYNDDREPRKKRLFLTVRIAARRPVRYPPVMRPTSAR
jgi:hypothetical protein